MQNGKQEILDYQDLDKANDLRIVITVRKVTKEECPWLEKDIEKGTELFQIRDLYGVCTPEGIAVTENHLKYPYFEIPKDSVKRLNVFRGNN